VVSFEAGGLRILHLFPEPFSGYTSRDIVAERDALVRHSHEALSTILRSHVTTTVQDVEYAVLFT
jgi:hypothetical protein